MLKAALRVDQESGVDPIYTLISKNVVRENGEWQLSNGDCTTKRTCSFHIWYAKTMRSLRGAKLILKRSEVGIGFNGAETNCGIAHILGILLMNSYNTGTFF